MTKLQISTIRKRLFVIVLFIVALFFFTGCFLYTGSRGGVVVPNLSVKGLPSNVSAISLTITGPGMKPVTSYFVEIPDTIEVEVPAGNDRHFDLTAHFHPTSAAILSRGKTTVDLVAGKSENIEITMIIEKTKLVIPDLQGSFGISRIIQIDDMSGSGWTELVGSGVGWADADFRPYDVDFDSQGRIYVANQNASTDYGRVFRVDDITGVNLFLFPDEASSMVALAVDQYNDYLYYASSTQLWRVNLDGSNDTALSMSSMTVIRGMAVGDGGLLYIAGSVAGAPAVCVYDPEVQLVTGTYTANIATPWDTYLRSPYVYVANLDGAAGYKIIQLDANLSLINSFGDQSTLADSVVGNFYGPKRFIGILPKKIVVLDEGSLNEPSGFRGDRLVAMDDLSGSGWQSYGQSGTGIGEFLFYYDC